MSNQIEGLAEGYEIVRWGPVHPGESRMLSNGAVEVWDGATTSIGSCLVVRKIEKPKKYRPFANAAEYKPHFDRPISRSWKHESTPGAYRVDAYDDGGVWFQGKCSYKQMFDEGRVFDDTGEPFGVEVTE